MEQQTDVKVKRRVGRPKLIKASQTTRVYKGVVESPNIQDHVMELLYDQPMNIKKIFTLFKLMDTRDIRMEFNLRSVRISGAGHTKYNFTNLHINCADISQYYCSHNMIMIIDQKNLEKVIQKIDTSYTSINFIAKQDSFMKELYIVLIDDSKGVREYHTISLLESSTVSDEDVISSLPYTNYPLSFVLPSKYFKKVISDISHFSKNFTIERRAGVPLSFPYDSNSKSIDVNHVFTNTDIFKIKCSLADNDFISTTIRIEFIQSLASALMSDNISVYVDKENMMVFKATIDNNIFTLLLAVDIVSYKNN